MIENKNDILVFFQIHNQYIFSHFGDEKQMILIFMIFFFLQKWEAKFSKVFQSGSSLLLSIWLVVLLKVFEPLPQFPN